MDVVGIAAPVTRLLKSSRASERNVAGNAFWRFILRAIVLIRGDDKRARFTSLEWRVHGEHDRPDWT